MRRPAALFALVMVSACGGIIPPAPPQPREPTKVNASFGKTWNAVVDAFAAENIPIRNMERASGFISTDILSVGRDAAKEDADCGSVIGMPLLADRATYNVVVRGDSSSSTVKSTVRWTQGGASGDAKLVECSTRGTWESGFESKVKGRAESGG